MKAFRERRRYTDRPNKQTLPLQEATSAAAYEAQRFEHERCAELLSPSASYVKEWMEP